MNKPMEYGFVDYNGNQWSNNAVDTYNRFNAEVAKRDTVHFKSLDSLAFKELEFYKDQRHKNFVQLMEIASGVKRQSSVKTLYVKEFVAD